MKTTYQKAFFALMPILMILLVIGIYSIAVADGETKEEVIPINEVPTEESVQPLEEPKEEPPEVVVEEVKPKHSYTEEEVYLLAQCVEAEAGVGNYKSQRYITQVILNRVECERGYPDTIKGVIYHKTNNGKIPQFSVAYNGSMEGRIVKKETLDVVNDVLENGTDLPKYVYFFYSEKVTNNWVNTLNTYDVIQGTVFAYASKEV